MLASFTQPTFGSLILPSSIRTDPFWLFVEYAKQPLFRDLKRDGLPKCFGFFQEIIVGPIEVQLSIG